MKNLGTRWTGPNIPRTAAARTSIIVAISLTKLNEYKKLNSYREYKLNIPTTLTYRKRCWTCCKYVKEKKNWFYSNIINKPSYLSVRNNKNYNKKTVNSKFKYNSIIDIIKSHIISSSYIHRFNYITNKTHYRHFRKC